MDDINIRWGYTFLDLKGWLPYRDKLDLIVDATRMYLDGIESEDVEGDGYEGHLFTEGKWGHLECYSGQVFEAELETQDGPAYLKFLVNEQTSGHSAGHLPAHLRN